MVQRLFTLLLVLLCANLTQAQNSLSIVQAPTYTMPCDSNCVWIKANFLKPKLTNTYVVASTAYAPQNIVGTTVQMYDDSFSSVLPLGFNFCFYGNSYNQCVISDNGILTFKTSYANAICYNNTQQLLPYVNSTFPDAAIFFPFADYNPVLGGSVKYATIGTAPNRKFVLDYQNFKLFGNSCVGATSSFQLVLCETSNQIYIYLTAKPSCDNNANNYANYATVGIQNQMATSYLAAPNRHASIWTSSNEAWLFDPAGSPAYNISWYSTTNNNALIASMVDSVKICPTAYPFKVWAKYISTCPAANETDTVKIIKNVPTMGVNTVQPFCTGDSSGSITITPNSVNPPVQASFNNGPFGSTFTWNGLPVGAYTITLQDAAGCKSTNVIGLQPLSNVVVVLDSVKKPVCPDSNGKISVHVNNATPPYTISWSNGDVGNTADSLWQGTWTATVVDANGCITSFSYLLKWDSLPVVLYNITKPICGDSTGAISVNPITGTAPFTYLWSTNATTPSINGVYGGLYNVVVTDANNCATNLNFYIVDTLQVLVDVDTIHTSCGLNNGVAIVKPSNGLAPYTFLWNNLATNDTVYNLPQGLYVCTTTAANGCKSINSVYINGSLPMINNINAANSNCDSNNGFIFTQVTQYTPPLIYLWSNGSNGNSLQNLSPGTYWVKLTDGIGCTRTDTIQIAEDGKPLLVINSYTPPLCWGDSTGSAELSGLQGIQPYKYSLDGIVFSSNAILNNVPGGSHVIYIRDANGCTNDTTIFFDQPDSTYVNYTADTLVCIDDKNASIHIQPGGGTGTITYNFNNLGYLPDTFFYNYAVGTYPLVIKDANNCIDTFTIVVPGPPDSLLIDFEKFDVPCLQSNNGYIVVKPKGGWGAYQFLWSNGEVSPVRNNLPEGYYLVTVKDAKGCEVAKEIQVKQIRCCNVVLPNAFSPNADNTNDLLTPILVSEVEFFDFKVFDRYGQLVFRTSEPGKGWNGRTAKGTPHELGTYFYHLEYKCVFDDTKKHIKGDVTLVR